MPSLLAIAVLLHTALVVVALLAALHAGHLARWDSAAEKIEG